MTEINEIRKQIDIIDKEMAMLFSKRMDLIKEIKKKKKKDNIDIVDNNRENNIKEENIKYVSEEYKNEYLEFIENILSISKNYQRKEE